MSKKKLRPGGAIDLELLKQLSQYLQRQLPDRSGFILIAFSGNDKLSNVTTTYVSNTNRKAMIGILEELSNKLRQAEALPKN